MEGKLRLLFRLFFIGHLLLFSNVNFGQNEDAIEADRPDQTEGTSIIPKGSFQFSDGFLIGDKTIQNDFILRYGLFNKTELRTSVSVGSYDSKFLLQPIMLTFKQKLLEADKIIPSISLLATATFEKLASKELVAEKIPLELIIAFSHDIKDRYFIAYNLGTTSWFKDLVFTCETGAQICDKTSVFLEYYAQYFNGDRPDQNIDAGITYLVAPRLQIDLAVGRSLILEKSLFFTTGFAYRFKRKIPANDKPELQKIVDYSNTISSTNNHAFSPAPPLFSGIFCNGVAMIRRYLAFTGVHEMLTGTAP